MRVVIEAAVETGIGGVGLSEGVLPEQLVGLAEQRVDEAALIELRGILHAVIGAAAAFDAIPAGEFVDAEQVAVVEGQGFARLRSASARSGVSFGRAMIWAIGSIVCVPQDCTLMNGYRYSRPTVGMARTRLLSPVLI